jgi:phosphatidylethanolamine/phosphatidyl-N-methylethanolamine N-methyltransferase
MASKKHDQNSKPQGDTNKKSCCCINPLRFLRQLVRAPGEVGAVAASGSKLCSTMAALAAASMTKSPFAKDAYLVELGAGTGVVTKSLIYAGINPDHLISIEKNIPFVKILRQRIPNIKVIAGSAENLQQHLKNQNAGQVATIVSSLPLLSLPSAVRSQIIEQMIETLPVGGDIIQFTYGLKAPYHDYSSKLQVVSKKFIAFNLPPAFVWHYKKI